MSDTAGVMPITSIIITCFVLIIVFRVIMTIAMGKVTGKKNSPQKSPSMRMNKPASHKEKKKVETRPVIEKEESGSLKEVFGNLEDRNNDWLAKQIREERESYVRASAMYGLKMHHERNCDARELRNSHSRTCDAEGVDTGASR